MLEVCNPTEICNDMTSGIGSLYKEIFGQFSSELHHGEPREA
jgi:hypothetical protein